MKMSYPMKPEKKAANLAGSKPVSFAVVSSLSDWKFRLTSANTRQERPVDLLISNVTILTDELAAA